MFSKLFGLAIVVIPLNINLSVAYAQSWQDWSQQNPAYKAPAPGAGNPSSQSPATSSTSPTPATWSNPSPQPNESSNPSSSGSPTSEEYFSTQNPLFEQQVESGCQQQGVPISYCRCVLKEIQNTYTFKEVVGISRFMQEKGEIPQELIDVAMKCVPS